MTVIFDKFLELMKALYDYDVEYVLIGGLAINLQGFARNTEDIDLFVNLSEGNVSKLQKALYRVFQDDDIFEITFDELNKYAVIRYGSQLGFYIDIISDIGEKFQYSDLSYELKEIDNIKIKVADVRTLYKLKEKTYREIDQLDLKFLKSKLEK